MNGISYHNYDYTMPSINIEMYVDEVPFNRFHVEEYSPIHTIVSLSPGISLECLMNSVCDKAAQSCDYDEVQDLEMFLDGIPSEIITLNPNCYVEEVDFDVSDSEDYDYDLSSEE